MAVDQIGNLVAQVSNGNRDAARTLQQLVAQTRQHPDPVEQALSQLVQMVPQSASAGEALADAVRSLPYLNTEIRKYLFRMHDVQDALQESAIAIVKGAPSFRQEAKFATWATSIARNKAIDIVRRNSSYEVNYQDEDKIEESFSSAVSDGLDVHAVLANCPEPYRTVVRLRDLEGLSYEEVGRSLDIKVNTVRSRLARGRAFILNSLDVPVQ